jgi:prevent-host-death family protein
MVQIGVSTIAVSKFKATCLEVLQRVKRTGKPVLVTRFGVPIAEICPPTQRSTKSWVGSFAGTGELVDDLVAPASLPGEWEASE